MTLKPIVIKNFISEEDCQKIVGHIEKNHYTYFNEWNGNRVYTQRFGVDPHYKDSTLETYKLYEIRDIVKVYANKTVEACKNSFNDSRNLYLNVLWLAKKNPSPNEEGQNVHGDLDGGDNMHFKYSAIAYFNDMHENGQIYFPLIDFEHCPSKGDLVIFPSDDMNFVHGVKPILQERYSMPMWITDLKEKELII